MWVRRLRICMFEAFVLAELHRFVGKVKAPAAPNEAIPDQAFFQLIGARTEGGEKGNEHEEEVIEHESRLFVVSFDEAEATNRDLLGPSAASPVETRDLARGFFLG